MKTNHPSTRIVSTIFLLLLIGLIAIPVSSQAAPDLSPDAVIQRVWELARQSGRYHFTTRIVQTTHPAPSIANVGRGSRTETTFLDGDADLPAETLRMSLWQNGGSITNPADAAEIRIEGADAYGRLGGGGAWQEIDNFSGGFAPGNDALGFLVAARNVRMKAEGGRMSNESSFILDPSSFVFDLSGPALADHLREQLEESLRQNGELPVGVHLDSPEQFRAALGSGELWVDEAGLPLRLSIHLEYPQQRNGERVEAQIVTDFSNFDREFIAGLQSPSARLKSSIINYQSKIQSPETLLSVSFLGLLALAVFNSRSKKIYAALVIVVIVSMVVTPLLQSAQVYAFQKKQNEQQAVQTQEQEAQDTAQDMRDELYGSDWDPHRGAGEQESMAAGVQIGELVSQPFAIDNAQLTIMNAASESNDDDPPPDSDDDGDGLTYAQEDRLGTDPERKDSDGDFITDNAEVAGFFYNGQMWYSDPSNPDSNNDGLHDGAECADQAVDADAGDLSPEGEVCQDTDGDGTPDIFDRDNDDDGVPDRVDISPFSVVYAEDGDPFDGGNPLAIQVDSLQSDLPVFLDIHIRPVDENHIWYAMNVLDWPSGDEDGQIQRRKNNNSTYEDLGDPADNATNGDMRLVPMLEIEIPYKDGHYGNLPVLEDAPDRTADLDLDEWLDRDALSDYGISVRPLNDDGDLVAYAPLNIIQDETGEDRVGFGARMLYWPTNTGEDGTTDWGNTQQARVIWVVQMLTDHKCTAEQDDNGDCTEGEWVLDTTQIVRGYDESWYLTGLSAREDHGLEIAIAYEDPAEEPSDDKREYDDWLWVLAHGLDQTFLTGRDEDEDGERDITIGEIHARFDNRVNGSTSDDERWGIPITATQVITFAYDHEDYFVHVMLTETQKIISDTFTAYKDNGADAPTLLFAQEAQYRAINLEDSDYVTQDGNKLTVKLDSEAFQQTARTFISWAPYRYNDEDDLWETYPIDEYLDKMEVRLKDALTEYEDEPDYEDILRGQIMLAQAHYLSLYSGAMSVVQVGSELVGNYGAEHSDGEMAEWITGIPFDKNGGAISRQTYTIANLMAKVVKYGNLDLLKHPMQFFKQLGQFAKGGQGGLLAGAQNWWKNASWKKFKLGTAIFGAVIAIGTLIVAAALYGGGQSKAAMIVLDVLIVSTAILDVIYTTRSVLKAFKASQTVGKFAKLKNVMKTKGMKYSAKAFAIAIVVAAVVMIAAFLIAWAASGERWDSLAFTYGLATVISSIITMVILIAIASIPIVGQIIAAIIFLFDAIFQIICHAQDREDDDFFCQGISGYVSQGVRWVIFSQNIMMNLADEERLEIYEFEQSFLDMAKGMSVGNSLIFESTVRNDIKLIKWKDTDYNWMAGLYWWQYNNNNLRSSSFVYNLDGYSKDRHASLDRGKIPHADWSPTTDTANSYIYYEDDTAESELTEAGINRAIPLYLNESYAVPAQECWLFPNPFFFVTGIMAIPVCYVRTERGSNNINLGENLRFDVFPATLDEFYDLTSKGGGYALSWSQDSSPAFPRLQDADGDGLRGKADGGADPNDLLWDSDTDRLSDFHENKIGSNPQDVDSDDDGLTDYDEVIYKTNPNLVDSDYDGLTDQEELDGWEFVYAFAEDGSQLRTWVTSDPTTLDGDGDGFSDFQEKTYGFHPRVPSDPNILTLENQISELDAPHLLLRLDEAFPAASFGDDSGYINNALCQGDHCPVAGHYGQYGNAPQFDGADDYLEVAHNDNLNPGSKLTLAAWVRLADPNADQKIIGKTTTNDGYLLGVGGGQLYPEIWDNQGTRYTAQWGGIPVDTWTHLALTWQSGGQMIGYINGTEVGRITASSHPIGNNENPLVIGIAPWNASSWPVEGRIDETLVFPRALSPAEIQEVQEGRYNPEDLTVKTGDTLYYESTVTNELFNRYAQGLLSTHFPAAFSELPPQDFVLNPQESITLTGEVAVGAAVSGAYTLTQEADALITNWREDSGYAEVLYHFSDADTFLEDSSGAQPPRDGECDSGHCPTLTTGRYGSGADFDGSDDYVTADAVCESLTGPALTFGGWFYPESGYSGGGALIAFNTGGNGNRNMVEYDYDTHEFYYYDSSAHTVRSDNTFAPNSWYHVMVVINENDSGRLYVNGIEEASFTTPVRPATDGKFSLGQEWDSGGTSEHFAGRMDEVVVYPRDLSAQDVQDHFNNPIFHIPFDEGQNATSFEDDSGFGNHATCTSGHCPQSGQDGIVFNAIRLDGEDYVTVPNSSALDLSNGDFTLSAWVYPERDGGGISACPFRTEYFTNQSFGSNENTVRKCEGWPINHEWGTGSWGPTGPYYYYNYFSVRWMGTFFFKEGDHTFTFVTDDGMRAWLDGSDQLLDEWHTQGVTTYHVDRNISAGWHTVTVEYFEEAGNATAKVSWSPGPLPQPQGILGAADYPALQRVGNRLRLVLNDTTVFLTTDEVLTPGDWNHVAASFDGSAWFLYVDGAEVDQFNIGGETPAAGTGFDIGRAASTASLDLQTLSVLDGGDTNNGGDSNLEIRIHLRLDGGNWQEVWSHDTVWADDYSLNLSPYTFSDQAQIKIYESDEGEYWNCGMYGCGGEDRDDEQMGTHTVEALSPSPHESATRYESDKGDKADLLWDAAIDSLPFEGKIDEVAIYKAALSPEDISDLYEAGTLVLRLPLDDAPGASDFLDALGAHNGSCSGAACPTAGVPGREEMALLFDGADDVVTINEANTADLQNLTVSTWVKLNSLPGGIMRFVTVGDEKAVLRYQDNSGGDLHFYIKTANGTFHHLRYGTSLQTGVWYHIAGTYDGVAMRLYLDSTEVASQPVSGELIGGDTVQLSRTNEALDGYLDEVRLYRRALDAGEIETLYNAAPEMLLLLDETANATSFADSTGNGHTGTCSAGNCPHAGTKGQIGLSANFDGVDDFIQVANAIPTGQQNLTLAAWVKPESLPDGKVMRFIWLGGEKAVLRSDGANDPGQMHFYMNIGGSLHGIRVDNALQEGYWHHVAGTYDGTTMRLYINGNEANSLDISGTVGDGSDLYLSHSNETLDGRLDHATLYTRALSPREIRAMFRLQAKWVEDRQHTEILVDNTAPASALISNETYRPNQDVVLLVNAEDEHTFVTLVEMGMQAPGQSGYTWSSAPPCEESQNGTAWCPTFEPTQGEGRYLLQFRATDNVGNRETPGATYTILVDDTPPATDTAIAEGEILNPARQPGTSWLVALTGTVADPNINGTSEPGSGVADVTVKLTDTDPVTDTLPALRADFGSGSWQVDYPLLEADPTGTYTLSVQSTDQMGNATEFITLITLGVDAAPPEADLNDITAQTGITGSITTTLQIGGQITETGAVNIGVSGLRVGIIPAAMASFSETVGIFHLDEPAGSEVFANDTGTGEATCSGATCPTAGEPGIWDTALKFSEDYNDANEYLSADGVTAAFSNTRGLSFGAWVYPKYNPGNRAILAFNTADGGLRNQIVHNDYTFRYRDGEVNIGIGYTWNSWAFVMVTIDENGNGVAYLDGDLAATFTTSVRPDPDGRFSIGQEWDGDIPSQHFAGWMDEIVIYSRALSPSEVHGLYANAELSDSGTGVIDATWAYTLPATFDGLYQINIRPEDVYSNTAPRNQWDVWTGEIDNRGPEVELNIVEESNEIGDLAGRPIFDVTTTYTCWGRDFNLVAVSATDSALDFQCPCQNVAPASTVITNTFYHEVSPWYAGVFTDTTRLYEHVETCIVPGLTTENFMQACDIYGHCTTDVADVEQLVEEIAVVYTTVITPAHQSILTSAGSINIEGRAYALSNIQQVNVYDGASFIGADIIDAGCTGNITSTQWIQSWNATEGQHALRSSVVPCTGGTNYGQSNTVYVDTTQPALTLFPTDINRDQRLSYGRVALGGDAYDDFGPIIGSGIARVEVSVEGADWTEGSIQDDDWKWEWNLGEEPDGAQYTVSVRAIDRAGWSTRITHTLTVDLDVPNPITMTMESASQVITPGLTIRTQPTTLDLSWEASEPSAKLSHYEVLWTVDDDSGTTQIPSVVSPTMTLASSYPAGESQRVKVQVTSVFTDGNRQVDDWSPVYVDTPFTPDYINLPGFQNLEGLGGSVYHGWMDSGCSALGIDRRVNENAQGGTALDDPQNLHVTWDSQALRIAWDGANWDYNGDLFIYLDDFTDPSVPLTAYNPFTDTQDTRINIPGAKAFIWVEDSRWASIYLWNGSSYDQSRLDETLYRFDAGHDGGLTNLYIPFNLLGISNPAATPLMLFAFAVEEGEMRLWGTMPPQNSVNSPRTVETDIYAGVEQVLEWAHVYSWPNLGPGVCPNGSVYTDVDLRFGISASPDGTAYGLMSSDLFWLSEDLTTITRTADFSQQFSFMDVDHLPTGDGETITYTLSYANHGAYTATGVIARATGLFALELTGATNGIITVTIGDIAPGALGSVNFTGVVDTSGPYQDWAVMQASVYDATYGPAGNPLDWLWVDHEVDSDPPEFFGILLPEYIIGAGENAFSGYAFDPSGVTALTMDAQPPSGGSYQTSCPDDSPYDGVWNCTWGTGAASDGDVYQISLRATDRHGQTSEWTEPRAYIVDTTAPTLTLSAESTAAYSGTVVSASALRFSGSARDDRGLGGVEACLDGECRAANLQTTGSAPRTFDDASGAAIPACGSSLERTFVVTESFILGGAALGFNANHPKRDEMQVTLESPLGTLVTIIAPPEGTANEYQNFDVYLDDSMTAGLHTKTDDDTATPAYDRLVRPDNPMAVFRGEGSAGTWTLRICDANPGTDAGTYNQSQLTLRAQNNAVTSGEWFYAKTGLEDQDYVSHVLEAYALDLAGNSSTEPISLTLWVDNVAPALSVSFTIELAATGPTPAPIRVMGGTASDGGAVQQFYAFVLSPSGNRLSLQIGRDGDNWWLDLTPAEAGEYTIWVNAIDLAGNATTVGPYAVTIVRVLAANNGPTALGTSTTLTATVQGDDGYSFDWNFGDSESVEGGGESVAHTYATTGTFTATVTANKGANTFTATTHVVVDEVISGLTAINDGPTVFGNTTGLTSTISTGSNVTYAWEFGDGQPSANADLAAPVHKYPAGTYTATVVAMNSVSVMTATTHVTVTRLTVANDSPTEVGETTIFTATLIGDTVSDYDWDFGDGSAVSDQPSVISHTYPLPGVYTATVGVESVAGTITATSAVSITGLGVINDSPTALSSATTFTATTSLTGTVTYGWDFGDSSNVVSGGWSVITHTYATTGTFTAVATATNGSEVLTATSVALIDNDAPTVVIDDPVQGQVITTTTYIIQGTAADDTALVWVEVSTDGGQTWARADGLENWTYTWVLPHEDQVAHTLLARVADQSGYITISQPVEVIVNTKPPIQLYFPLIMR